MIVERYRKDYTGEFIITNTVWSGGRKRTQREWMPNPIENHHISGRAACIASDVDVEYFDFTILPLHKGGLLGSVKLQTYGVGNIAKMMRLDFTVEKDDQILNELNDIHYYKQNIIYTTPRNCLRHPGVFYTIPYNPPFVKEVLLPYLAAFDGHREIFLLGYTENAQIGQDDWAMQMTKLFGTYPSTKFFHVGHKSQTPEIWLDFANVEQLTHREFITHCDI